MDLAQALGQLPVLAHRVGQPRDADQRRVGGDQQDHRRQHADVVAEDFGRHVREAEVLDDAEDRVVGEGGAERGAVVAGGVLGRPASPRGRRSGSAGRGRARRRRRGRRCAGSCGPRPSPPRPCWRSSRSRCRRSSRPRSRARSRSRSGRRRGGCCRPATCGLKTRTRPIPTRTTWVARSAMARTRFSFADSSVPRTLSSARPTISTAPPTMSPGPSPEPGPEDGQVVGHEEGRDRDRDRVVEHLPPGGDEADQLVEGVAGEAGGAAGLRVHHRRLGVGGGGGRRRSGRR